MLCRLSNVTIKKNLSEDNEMSLISSNKLFLDLLFRKQNFNSKTKRTEVSKENKG